MPPTTVRSVPCHHCGTPFDTKRPEQAKWCLTCKTLKSLAAFFGHPSKCTACKATFYKAHRHHILCPDCDPNLLTAYDGDRTCALCDTAEHLLPGVRICQRCAADPKKHSVVVAAVAKSFKARGAKEAT